MDKPYVVGMDIGGTNSVFGIVDARGNILSVDSVKTQAYKEFGDYVAAVAEKLLPMIEAVGGTSKIKGINTVIVHNRLDLICPFKGAYDLHIKMNNSELIAVEEFGHVGNKLHKTIMNKLNKALK